MRALFLGLGGVGQRHLRNLLEIAPDAEIGAMRHARRRFEIKADLQADQGVDIEEKYAIARFESMDEAAAWKPDLAVVASPTSAHVAQVAELVRHGIPVLVEKPVSADEQGLAELEALVERTGVLVCVGYMFRFHPGVRTLFSWMEEGRLGRVYSGQVRLSSFMPSWHPYESYKDFYAGSRALGGGAILSEIHELDLLHHMLGSPKRLLCSGGQVSPFEMDVEDVACALLEYEIGGRPAPVTVNMSFVQRPPERIIQLWGERGRILWDALAQEAVFSHAETGAEERFAVPDFERNQMFVDEMRAFLDAVAGRAEPVAELRGVMGGHRVALAMKRSLESGRPVSLG